MFQESLPSGYEYHYCSFTPETEGRHFAACVRIAVKDVDGALGWLKDYQEHTKVTWRVGTTKPESGRVNLLKKYYRCQHNTKPRTSTVRPGSKDSKCPAQLTLTVKRLQGKHSK
jgi:hypothetical protein